MLDASFLARWTRALFFRTQNPTGRMLLRAFGADVDLIVWGNASPFATGDRHGLSWADQEHVARLMRWADPRIVIAFGRSAQAVVRKIAPADVVMIETPHPQAFGVGRPAELLRVARTWRALVVGGRQERWTPEPT